MTMKLIINDVDVFDEFIKKFRFIEYDKFFVTVINYKTELSDLCNYVSEHVYSQDTTGVSGRGFSLNKKDIQNTNYLINVILYLTEEGNILDVTNQLTKLRVSSDLDLDFVPIVLLKDKSDFARLNNVILQKKAITYKYLDPEKSIVSIDDNINVADQSQSIYLNVFADFDYEQCLHPLAKKYFIMGINVYHAPNILTKRNKLFELELFKILKFFYQQEKKIGKDLYYLSDDEVKKIYSELLDTYDENVKKLAHITPEACVTLIHCYQRYIKNVSRIYYRVSELAQKNLSQFFDFFPHVPESVKKKNEYEIVRDYPLFLEFMEDWFNHTQDSFKKYLIGCMFFNYIFGHRFDYSVITFDNFEKLIKKNLVITYNGRTISYSDDIIEKTISFANTIATAFLNYETAEYVIGKNKKKYVHLKKVGNELIPKPSFDGKVDDASNRSKINTIRIKLRHEDFFKFKLSCNNQKYNFSEQCLAENVMSNVYKSHMVLLFYSDFLEHCTSESDFIKFIGFEKLLSDSSIPNFNPMELKERSIIFYRIFIKLLEDDVDFKDVRYAGSKQYICWSLSVMAERLFKD